MISNVTLECDGTSAGSMLCCNGHRIDGVTNIEFSLDAESGFSKMVVTVIGAQVKLATSHVEVEMAP